MSETLRTLFLVLLFALIVTLQFNMDADKTATRQIKNALELATHDAALALDESQLAQGKIVFDQEQANLNFETSLKDNLKLRDLAPTLFMPDEESYYSDLFQVEYLEYIDDNSGVVFPYNYSNPDYDIVDTLNGPSVIAVLTTKSPRYFAGDNIRIRKAVVYEYFN